MASSMEEVLELKAEMPELTQFIKGKVIKSVEVSVDYDENGIDSDNMLIFHFEDGEDLLIRFEQIYEWYVERKMNSFPEEERYVLAMTTTGDYINYIILWYCYVNPNRGWLDVFDRRLPPGTKVSAWVYVEDAIVNQKTIHLL